MLPVILKMLRNSFCDGVFVRAITLDITNNTFNRCECSTRMPFQNFPAGNEQSRLLFVMVDVSSTSGSYILLHCYEKQSVLKANHGTLSSLTLSNIFSVFLTQLLEQTEHCFSVALPWRPSSFPTECVSSLLYPQATILNVFNLIKEHSRWQFVDPLITHGRTLSTFGTDQRLINKELLETRFAKFM